VHRYFGGRSARACVADSVSRWLDWTEANRLIYLGTVAPGEDINDPMCGARSLGWWNVR